MGDNPYRVLKKELAQLVAANLPLEQVMFTVVVGDDDGEADHVQCIFKIDNDKLGTNAAEVAEKAIFDAQFASMMKDQRAADLDEQEKSERAEAEENLKRLLEP